MLGEIEGILVFRLPEELHQEIRASRTKLCDEFKGSGSGVPAIWLFCLAVSGRVFSGVKFGGARKLATGDSGLAGLRSRAESTHRVRSEDEGGIRGSMRAAVGRSKAG